MVHIQCIQSPRASLVIALAPIPSNKHALYPRARIDNDCWASKISSSKATVERGITWLLLIRLVLNVRCLPKCRVLVEFWKLMFYAGLHCSFLCGTTCSVGIDQHEPSMFGVEALHGRGVVPRQNLAKGIPAIVLSKFGGAKLLKCGAHSMHSKPSCIPSNSSGPNP